MSRFVSSVLVALVVHSQPLHATALPRVLEAGPGSIVVGDPHEGPYPDLTSVGLELDAGGGTVVFDLRFASPVSPPDGSESPWLFSGQAATASEGSEGVVGYIFLDTDRDPFTGSRGGASAAFCAAEFVIGNERVVDLFTYDPDAATVVVRTATGAPTGLASAVFGETSLLVTIPVAALDDDGIVNAIVAVGTTDGPVDCVPGNGVITNDPDYAAVPPPPSDIWLHQPPPPGTAAFRTQVRITAPGSEPILGSEEPCLPETLCVSGALPGRTEVLVRIVGPKPNGRLWPTIVKLTTSQVEVWIENFVLGELRYYLLEGASPGNDVLPGLFDRSGFEF
jgi:hypothetical protein